MNKEIQAYNNKQTPADKDICDRLATIIDKELAEAENKIWHSHPVWFIDGNPIVGYSKQKLGIRLMFWSGADFEEEDLTILGKKFRDASAFYNNASEIKPNGAMGHSSGGNLASMLGVSDRKNFKEK